MSPFTGYWTIFINIRPFLWGIEEIVGYLKYPTIFGNLSGLWHGSRRTDQPPRHVRTKLWLLPLIYHSQMSTLFNQKSWKWHQCLWGILDEASLAGAATVWRTIFQYLYTPQHKKIEKCPKLSVLKSEWNTSFSIWALIVGHTPQSGLMSIPHK